MDQGRLYWPEATPKFSHNYICYIKEVHKRNALLYIALITNQSCYQCISLHVLHINIGYLVLFKQYYLLDLSIYLLDLYFHLFIQI